MLKLQFYCISLKIIAVYLNGRRVLLTSSTLWNDPVEYFLVGFSKSTVIDVTNVNACGVGIGVSKSTGDDGKVDVGVVGQTRPRMAYDIRGQTSL